VRKGEKRTCWEDGELVMLYLGGGVRRQYQLVFLVEVRLWEGKALGSEKGKGLGSAFLFVMRREVWLRLYCV
jgi:hypothetical protein